MTACSQRLGYNGGTPARRYLVLVTDEEHPQVKTVGWFLDGPYWGNAEVIRVHQ